MFGENLSKAHSVSAPAHIHGYNVLESLKDYEINPQAKQELSRKIVQQQIFDFMNVHRHGDRILPKWNDRINLHTLGLTSDLQTEMFSSALNQMSLLTNVEIGHQSRLRINQQGFGRPNSVRNPYSNALVIFVDGKEPICFDDRISNALQELGKDPIDVYQRIEQNCHNNKQATEYRCLRYDQEGATFFLYIVDISWVREMAADEIDEQNIYRSQFLQAAFRLFSLQDGVSDTVKYSFMNHKYFWKSMRELAPVDCAFLSSMYCEQMARKRRKLKSANYISQLAWRELKDEE
ncbi:MAG: hypothetical protein ACRBHB_10365 [Arenicella sp.]